MVNYISILLASVIGMVIGSLWYSKLLFGKKWMKLEKIGPKTMEKMKQRPIGKILLVAFLSLVVTNFVLALVLDYLPEHSWNNGLLVAGWLWLGFIATTQLSPVLWKGQSFKLYLLNVGQYLIAFLAMGAFIGWWG
jgi:hypothetical protein